MAGAVLIDLDGTLWDSWPWYAGLLTAESGKKVENHVEELKGGASAAALLKAAGISQRQIIDACAVMPPPLYPGARETMTELQTAGTPIGAVTNLPKWLFRPMLDAFGDLLQFGTVIGWSDGPRKPRPEPLLRALSNLGLEPGPAHWYIGDTQSDAQATNSAGLRFGWASWGYAEVPPEGTETELRQFSQIADLVS